MSEVKEKEKCLVIVRVIKQKINWHETRGVVSVLDRKEDDVLTAVCESWEFDK
jgi:hypothetical protein